MPLILFVVLVSLMTATANAAVIKSDDDGFILQHEVTIDRDKVTIFKTMTSQLGEWWNPAHSFSSDAGNMLVDAECFCERWGGNVVHHLDTTIWIENSKVVMEGGLGPLKELGLSGTMIWSLTQNDDAATDGAGTTVTWKYHVYGFSETDLPDLATAVDGVLKEQIDRLANHLR
jgi:hypothetical protein